MTSRRTAAWATALAFATTSCAIGSSRRGDGFRVSAGMMVRALVGKPVLLEEQPFFCALQRGARNPALDELRIFGAESFIEMMREKPLPACQRIAATMPAKVAAGTTPALDPMRAAVARVQEWRWADAPQEGPPRYGDTRFSCDGMASVTLYQASCGVGSLYGLPVTAIPAAPRNWLIAAHELGHVVDFLNGDVQEIRTDDGCMFHAVGAAEDRATYYGTFFLECMAYELAAVMERNGTPLMGAAYLDAAEQVAQTALEMRRRYDPARKSFDPATSREFRALFGCP